MCVVVIMCGWVLWIVVWIVNVVLFSGCWLIVVLLCVLMSSRLDILICEKCMLSGFI